MPPCAKPEAFKDISCATVIIRKAKNEPNRQKNKQMLRNSRLFSIDYLNSLLDHDALINYEAAEHIDWTAATENLYTTGSGRFDGGIGVGANPTANVLLWLQKTLSTPIEAFISNLGTGDARLNLYAGSDWVLGIDNSASKFKIAQHTSLTTNTVLEIDTSGNFDFKTGNFAGVGTIAGGAYNGVTISTSALGGVILDDVINSHSVAIYGDCGIIDDTDGFYVYGGTTERILTVTGGDWTLDQDVSSGAAPTLDNDNITDNIGYLKADGSVALTSAWLMGAQNFSNTGQAAIGTGISATNWFRVYTPKHVLNTTGSRWAFGAVARAQATANTSNVLGGFVGGSQTFGAYNYTGAVYGLLGKVEHIGTGTITNAYGLWGLVANFDTVEGTITNAKVIKSTLDAEDGTVVAGYMFIAETADVDNGALTTVYSFYDAGQTNADNNWGFYGLSANNYLAGKLAFGQTDKNEYIDSLADGYMDYGATTAHRFNNDTVLPKTSGKGIKIDTTTPTFGWRDLLGQIRTRGVGGTDPGDATYIGNIKAYQFAVNDECWVDYHIPHDYVAGTDIFLHFHWSHIGTFVTGGSVTWGADITYAKGHNQAAFPASVNTTVVGNASTAQYQHIITEVQISASTPSGNQIDTDDLEPDGVIMIRGYLSANNITVSEGAVPDPFLHFKDIHYQSTNIATKDKVPDFYA